MRKVDPLRELQAVDTALDQARARLARINAQFGRREALDAAIAARDAAQAVLRERQAAQLDLELEVDKLRAKVNADSEKLYSGRIHNPRELQDMTHEVEQDRRLVSEREDRLIAIFDQVEAAEAAARQAEDAFQRVEAAWKREQEAMTSQRRQIEAEGNQLTARRAQIAAQADPASLRLYDSLRRSKNGLAVVAVQQRTCQGCRIALPSSEEQKARASDELVLCSSCGRILYAT
jgi:predicted  nucleic acid-binding Zn-ribbon protein